MRAKVLVNQGLAAVLAALALACAGSGELYAPQVARMDADEVLGKLGSPGFHVIDVRYRGDWTGSDVMIAESAREDPFEVSAWAGDYAKGETLVVYCA